MWTETKIYKYKSKITDAEMAVDVSAKYRNILDFDLEFNTSTIEQYDLAEIKINRVKFDIANLLKDEYSFYHFSNGSLNAKEARLATKIKTDNESYLSKIYTVPEIDLSFTAKVMKYTIDQFKGTTPNVIYCHKDPYLISEENLDFFVASKLGMAINDSEFSFYKDKGFELMLIEFIGWIKVRVVELHKINGDLLGECLKAMRSHELVSK